MYRVVALWSQSLSALFVPPKRMGPWAYRPRCARLADQNHGIPSTQLHDLTTCWHKSKKKAIWSHVICWANTLTYDTCDIFYRLIRHTETLATSGTPIEEFHATTLNRLTPPSKRPSDQTHQNTQEPKESKKLAITPCSMDTIVCSQWTTV